MRQHCRFARSVIATQQQRPNTTAMGASRRRRGDDRLQCQLL
jgi:hypothetical protein